MNSPPRRDARKSAGRNPVPFEDTEPELVFRHFVRVLERLTPGPQGKTRARAAPPRRKR